MTSVLLWPCTQQPVKELALELQQTWWLPTWVQRWFQVPMSHHWSVVQAFCSYHVSSEHGTGVFYPTLLYPLHFLTHWFVLTGRPEHRKTHSLVDVSFCFIVHAEYHPFLWSGCDAKLSMWVMLCFAVQLEDAILMAVKVHLLGKPKKPWRLMTPGALLYHVIKNAVPIVLAWLCTPSYYPESLNSKT